MSEERVLTPSQCGCAADIQQAIDQLAPTGGRLVLPELELTLDRGLELASNVELVGQGDATVLRKAPGRVYPLTGYHNYGMCDVPLESTEGLQPGMTVSIHDDLAQGYYQTFARLTWVEDGWVGLDRGLEADYRAGENPRLVTVYPLVSGHDVANAAVRGLTLLGDREGDPQAMGGCRGSAVYFIRSREIEVTDVHERGYHGEGMGLQMCAHVLVRGCSACENTGNGLHPGSGSTAVRFENCTADGNDKDGFFFCVRANHITVRGCSFAGNGGAGVSIGTRDCHNRIEDCRTTDNRGPAVTFRQCPPDTHVHSILLRSCEMTNNAIDAGQGQIEILGQTHRVVLENNHITGPAARQTPGIHAAETTRDVFLADNEFSECHPDLAVPPESLAPARPDIETGHDTTRAEHFRHLRLPRGTFSMTVGVETHDRKGQNHEGHKGQKAHKAGRGQ